MKRFLFAAITAASLTACSNESDIQLQEDAVPLSCQFTAGWDQGRSLIEGNLIYDHVGITIGADEHSLGSYFGKTGYYNLDYYPSGSSVGTDGIGLYKGQETCVYAYSPYSIDVKDIKAIHVHSSPAGVHDDWRSSNDYLWGRSANKVSGGNPVAKINMNHALAVVKVVIQRDSYAETGTVNNTTISGTGFAASAKLNSLNGHLSDFSTETAKLTSADSYVMPLKNQEPHVTNFIVIPNGKDAPLDFSVNIDGEIRTAKSQNITFRPGHKYTFTVKVKEDGNVIDTVLIKEWEYDENLNPTAMVNGHRVTIHAAPGISVQTERTETTLKVTAINYGSESPIQAQATGHEIKTVPFGWGGVAGRGLDITVAAPAQDVDIHINLQSKSGN